MARPEYDLELRRYDGRARRAMFFPSGFEHSLTSHAGTAWARSPWEAVQRAARDSAQQRLRDRAVRLEGDGRVSCLSERRDEAVC
jgi:hypothetical protein